METAQGSRFDLTGDKYRMTLGSAWVQPFTYFLRPEPGVVIGQVVELVTESPLTYRVILANGTILSDIPSDDVTEWVEGDWVQVRKRFGAWTIIDPGAAVLEDMENVLRAVCEVRSKSDGRAILTFDSANASDPTKPSIRISPDVRTTFQLWAPAQASIPPFVYKYDVFFYRSASAPFDPVMRQFGDFEIADSITKRTV